MANKKKKSSKPRSAKQKAADIKNGARLKKLNKQKKKGIKSKVKRVTTKIKNKVTKRKANKPRKKSNGTLKSLKSITGSSTLKKVALGVGGAAIATAVISMIMPNSAIARYAGPIGGYAMGGIEGVLGAMVLPMVAGRAGGNSNVTPAMEVL
jgi:hypothetical protein